MWEIARNWSILLLIVSLVLSFGNKTGEPRSGGGAVSENSHSSPSPSWFISPKDEEYEAISFDDPFSALEYDHYRDTCPQAEQIVRSMVRYFHSVRPDTAPQLLRLVFHDCFIQGCDGSVLLDGDDLAQSEKDASPNETLKGFDLIDYIKSEIEEVCPETVSCADILVLAARDSVVMAGGPFYPLYTGRRDSYLSFPEIAAYELPSPHDSVSKMLLSFASRGFDERETVSLLGAHNIGMVHCKFFRNRLYNFRGSGQPDPSVEPRFLNFLRSKCNGSTSSSSSETEDAGMVLNYDETNPGFGNHYFQSVELGRGILYADQQLIANEGTANWVHSYAADRSLFEKDFARAMMKLSNLRVLTGVMGQVRRNCSKISPEEG